MRPSRNAYDPNQLETVKHQERADPDHDDVTNLAGDATGRRRNKSNGRDRREYP